MNNDRTDGEQGSALNGGPHSVREHKVVIKMSLGEVIRGYVELREDVDPGTLFDHANGNAPTIAVKLVGSKAVLEIPLRDTKAVFLVKSFRGDPRRKDLRFYVKGPAVGSIWAEIRFKDNEILEGLIENSVQHLRGNGFLLKPSDVSGNNTVVYVNKAAVESYRVLGVRAHEPTDN